MVTRAKPLSEKLCVRVATSVTWQDARDLEFMAQQVSLSEQQLIRSILRARLNEWRKTGAGGHIAK